MKLFAFVDLSKINANELKSKEELAKELTDIRLQLYLNNTNSALMTQRLEIVLPKLGIKEKTSNNFFSSSGQFLYSPGHKSIHERLDILWHKVDKGDYFVKKEEK